MDDLYCTGTKQKHDLHWRFDDKGERFVCINCRRYWRHDNLPKWYRVAHAQKMLDDEKARE